MRCIRCNGLMILERFTEMHNVFHAWRCFICGEILDTVVIRNRYRRQGEGKKHLAAGE